MMNRPRCAFPMREKSAAAMPVRLWAILTVSRSLSSALMISAGQDALKLLGIRPLAPHNPQHLPAPAHHLRHLPFHLRALRPPFGHI